MQQTAKIRERVVSWRKPEPGRGPEFQVVQGRKVMSRHDMQQQAERWCRERGIEVTAILTLP